MKNWRKGGTPNFPGWVKGVQITEIAHVEQGQILFDVSIQFDSVNLCRVTRKDAERGIFYATFVNPSNTAQGRNGLGQEPEFAVWDFNLSSGRSAFYQAKTA